MREIEKFKGYKSILWLDDLDEQRKNPGDMSDSDCILANFGLLHEKSLVHHVKEYSQAIKAITSGYQYDLVVFDMNWIDADIRIHGTELSKHGVILPEDLGKQDGSKITPKESFIERAGAYLYHLLLLQGYPSNRMIILTHNNIDIPKNTLRKTGLNDISIYPKEEAQLEDHHSEYFWDRFFQEDTFYYRIRRLVFQACEYWKNKLKAEEDKYISSNEILFNKIYFPNNNEIQISAQSFIETLERIKMLFPVVKPLNPEQIYYQALQTAAMIHEESANIQNAKQKKEFPYHSMIRNFRNWSAHNRFEESNLDGEQFALLFCIALRTFFDSEHEQDEDGFYTYEKIFDFTLNYQELDDEAASEISDNFSADDLADKLKNIWLELRKLNWEKWDADEKDIRIPEDTKNVKISENWMLYGRLSNLIYQIPHNCKAKVSKKYLFATMWCESANIKDSMCIHKEYPKTKTNTESNSKFENTVNIRVSYKWQCDIATCQEICDTATGNKAEAVFMRYCYRWI